MLSANDIVIKACLKLDGYTGTFENMQSMLTDIGFFQMRNSIGQAVGMLQTRANVIGKDHECECYAEKITEVINVLTD